MIPLHCSQQPPKQKISDPEELADYQHRKRRAFEDGIRKNRSVITNWIKYAQWEESQKEVPRYKLLHNSLTVLNSVAVFQFLNSPSSIFLLTEPVLYMRELWMWIIAISHYG